MTLITGATGLVGTHLLLKLVEEKEDVRALYRTESKLEEAKRIFGYYVENASEIFTKIQWLKCDITDLPALTKAFVGTKKVYHCAAYISFDPNNYKKLQKSNVEGTANVVNLCIENNVEKLCYVSSIATLGSSTAKEPVTENSEFNAIDANVYALTKHDAELEVWRGTQEGVPAVIVNPGVILGPGHWLSGSGAFFSENARQRKYYLPGGTGFVGIDDVVNAMVTLMKNDVENERYILVAENLSYKEIQHRIASEFGLQPAKKPIKPWMLEFFWRIDWVRSKLSGSKRVLSKAMAKSLPIQTIYNSNKIETELNTKLNSIEGMITFCCQLYREEHLGS